MDVKLKNIFLASVDSVTPKRLVAQNKLLTWLNKNRREFIEIRKNDGDTMQIDITDKRIHVGEY